MILAFLIAASALFAQDSPVTNQNGAVVGVLRNAAGAPAAGVRVSALLPPEAIKDIAAGASFAALGETDSAGRYRLDNIPPGRYYIVAGRLDSPTYFPGTVQPTEGTVVSIAAGATVSGIDFVLNNGSVGRANADLAGSPTWVIPIQTRMEGGGKIPLFVAGRFPVLRLARTGGAPMDVPLSVPNMTVPAPGAGNSTSPFSEFRVTVENLPETYGLKSLTFGSSDLRTAALQLPRPGSGSLVTQSIVVTLTGPAMPQLAGIRITGRIPGDARRAIYISGNPGAVYSDGTFEFIGVAPGRHAIVTLDNPGSDRPLGAALVVGSTDLLNIELEDISIAPANADRPKPPAPAGNRVPGSRIATASIRGRVLDGDTKETFNAGRVALNDNYSFTFSLNDDGSFDIPRLLPGTYKVEALVFGVGTVSRTVVLDDQDTTIELTLGAPR